MQEPANDIGNINNQPLLPFLNFPLENVGLYAKKNEENRASKQMTFLWPHCLQPRNESKKFTSLNLRDLTFLFMSVAQRQERKQNKKQNDCLGLQEQLPTYGKDWCELKQGGRVGKRGKHMFLKFIYFGLLQIDLNQLQEQVEQSKKRQEKINTQMVGVWLIICTSFKSIQFRSMFQELDYSPAVFIRNITQKAILPFADATRCYRSDQLRLLLISIFKYREYEVSYELMKALCFGKNKYISITAEQLTDYLMEKYLGENTINKYAYNKGYSRREEKIMNKSQFIETLQLGLAHFEEFKMAEYLEQFYKIFGQLDREKYGVITQEVYCEFLKHYLGSESPMAVNPTKRVTQMAESEELIPSVKEEISEKQIQSPVKSSDRIEQDNHLLSNKEISAQPTSNKSIKTISALQEFRDLIVTQITTKCQEYDENKDKLLVRKDCEKLLYEVLQLEYHSIGYIISNYFNFDKNGQISYPQLVEIVSEVHFREILSNIIKSQHKIDSPTKVYLQKSYFINKIQENCYFFNRKPTHMLLQRVYEELLSKSQSKTLITLQDFRAYILVHCCNNKLIFRSTTKKMTTMLTVPPQSIMEVENSNYEEDQSGSEQFRISKKDFQSGKEREVVSRQSIQGQIGSNRQIKRNRVSEHNIYTQYEAVKDQQLQNKPFKQILWDSLQRMLSRYAKKADSMLDQQQCDNLFDNQSLFQDNKQVIKAKISRLFARQSFISFEQLTSFIIHLKGEEALIIFNKTQIKGKSTLNEHEVSSILCQAFGKLWQKRELFAEFSKLLFAQNAKNVLSYKNYLQLIARNLSIKNNF